MTKTVNHPPDPGQAGTPAEFVQMLVDLRRWAGEPPLSVLRSLGGQTESPDGTTVDALPKSTVSHILRQRDKLPRWSFVQAFVTACLRHCDYPADRISEEIERWRLARAAIAGPPARAPRGPDLAGGPATAPGNGPAAAAAAAPATGRTAASATGPTTAPAAAPAGLNGPSDPAGLAGSAPDPAPQPPPTPAPGSRHTAPTGLDPALNVLIRRVAREEDRMRKSLLGGYSIAAVSYDTPERPAGDGGDDRSGRRGGAGDLSSIGTLLSTMAPQRLLIVGEPGAGKTVFAVELTLQLLEPLLAADRRDDRRPALVPVRLDAARWSARQSFEEWLTDRLVRDFGLSSGDATRLVADRRVLPVLDGLDELDPDPAQGPPRRAIGLLTELNRYSDLSGRRPGAVVVTCRTDRYAALTRARVTLEHSTRIHLRDLTVDQIDTYLRTRWPDGHPCAVERDRIMAALSGPSGAAVRAALTTPWQLLLATTAVEAGSRPEQLLCADPDDDPRDAAARINERLLEAYIPAATTLTPRRSPRERYDPARVHAWLRRIAAHLQWQADQAATTDNVPPGLTAIDIVPHLLWPIGGRRLVRALHGLLAAVLAVAAMGAFWVGAAIDDVPGGRTDLDAGSALTSALMASWVAIAVGLSVRPWPPAAGGRSNVPLRRRLVGAALGGVAGAVTGLVGGLVGLALTGGKVFGPAFASTAGAVGGAVLGCVVGVTAAGRSRRERLPLRKEIRAQPAVLLGFGLCGALTGLPPLRLAHAGPISLVLGLGGTFVLAFALGTAFTVATGGWSQDAELTHPREALRRNPTLGVAFGLTGGVAAVLVFTMNQSVPVSLACALVGGVTFGLSFGATAWCRSLIGLLVAAGRGLLPLRLWTFLDWACQARLLRVSGPTYQFRHRELQDFLTRHELPSGAPVSGMSGRRL